MAKKVKKVVSSVLKPVSSVLNPVSGLLGGGSLGVEKDSSNAALEASNAALEAALEQQRQAAQNAQVDLSVENIPTIDTGGTAEAQAEAGTKARRRRTGGLASSLGINVG